MGLNKRKVSGYSPREDLETQQLRIVSKETSFLRNKAGGIRHEAQGEPNLSLSCLFESGLNAVERSSGSGF